MSCGNRYRCLHWTLEDSDETTEEHLKRQKISYTRDFLLSICDSDTCRRLPRGFNSSILRELEVAKDSTSSGFSRGICVKGVAQSYGPTGRDSQHSHSDPLRPYGHQYRHFGQNPEHDGLLGNGAILKLPLCAPRVQNPNVPGNSHLQVLPMSRRESKDSYNDETFGSVECLTQERAGEEERRKASFELMRMERQNAIQEKQNQIREGHKEKEKISTLGDESRNNEAFVTTNNELEDNVVPRAMDDDSAYTSFSIPSPPSRVSRPIFPPGFITGSLEKNSLAKSLHSLAGEEDNGKEADSLISDTNKFRHWSLEGEKKLVCGHLSESEKSKPQVSELSTGKNTAANLQTLPLESKLLLKLTTSASTSSKDSTSEKMYSVDNPIVNSSQILTCEDLEQSILLDVHRHGSVHQLLMPDDTVSDLEKQQMNPGNGIDNSVPQDLLSLSKKGGSLMDLAKLKMRSSGNHPVNSGPHSTSSTEKITVNNLILKEIPGSEFMEELQPVEASVSVKSDSFPRIPKDVSEFDPVFDHNLVPAVAEVVLASNSHKQNRLVEEGIKNLVHVTARAEKGTNSQLGKMEDLSPVTRFDEKTYQSDEFCFPDEDSLIGVDDFIMPQHSTFVSSGDLINGDARNTCASVNIAEKLGALNLPFGNDKHIAPHLEGPCPPYHHCSCGIASSESPCHNSCAWNLNPQFHHANLNAGGAHEQLLGSCQSDIISQVRCMDPNSYFYNPSSQHNDFHAHYSPSPHTCVTGYDFPVHESLLQRVPMDVNGLLSGAPHPQPNGRMSCYAEELNSMQRFNQYSQGPGYGARRMFNQDAGSIAFGPTNQVAFDMELKARQMHPSVLARGGSGTYGKGVGGHRYGIKPPWY